MVKYCHIRREQVIMATSSVLPRNKISCQTRHENEPSSKRPRKDFIPAYPVDFIRNEDDVNDVDKEMELLNNTDSFVKCGHCGRDVSVKVSQGKSPNIIYHLVYGDSAHNSRKHHIAKLMCYAQGAAASHVAALRICQRWWTIEEVLSSNDLKREGIINVSTFGERIVLSLLNRIIYRYQEHCRGEPTFLSHPPNEMAKLIWVSSKAVGFYTIKQKGKLVNEFFPEPWAMNVLDTIFVRKSSRHQGMGTKMVEDFLSSYPKQDLGLSWPLAEPLKKLCYKLLVRRKADRSRVWECSDPTGPPHHANLWLSLQEDRKPAKPRLG